MEKVFEFADHGVCRNSNEYQVIGLVGDVEVKIWTALHEDIWHPGFECSFIGRKVWRPSCIGYPGCRTEREAKYLAFSGVIELFRHYLDILYEGEWYFGEYDEDPAYVLEEWLLKAIERLKMERSYYDEDVIFNIDEYGTE